MIKKGIIYYSDGVDVPLKQQNWANLVGLGLPMTESHLKKGQTRSYKQMVTQIIDCLKRNPAKYVFFCEHDVIYDSTHFEFTPEKDNIFYYNSNVWRWDYPNDRYFTYDRLLSLSALCVNREFALDHFKRRLKAIPKGDVLCRKMGYEPGTKKKKRGGFSDDDFETWQSRRPLIDIRHSTTFSPRKVNLSDFKHQPTGWKETNERP